jgi:glucose-6-phosphate isomerase
MFTLLLSNTRVDAFSIAPGSLADAYAAACRRLQDLRFASALWSRSLDVWSANDEVRQKIANRLGWLGALDFVEPQLPRLTSFAESVRAGGFTDVVLLGMGGSSLAPEVMRQVFGVAPGLPRFRMLDSVDPDAVRDALTHAATSLFVLASKSGSTIEPNVMAAEARRRLAAAGHEQWGSRFVAITDENTLLHRLAVAERFREVFVNPSDIGGRYSALSYFGMVPAALLGTNLERFTSLAREMERACRDTGVQTNPGLALGALMAAGASTGRDKMTLLLPARLRTLGLWVEQLVAESTGKQGKGVVPIAGEAANTPFGDDRFAVHVHLDGDPASASADSAGAAGLPLATLNMPGPAALGAEFLRWEVATATAGLLLEINPFDEPNVQQAKDATRALLDVYVQERRLPTPQASASVSGSYLSLSRAAEDALNGESAMAFLRLLKPGDYFGLLAYLPPDRAEYDDPLQAFREEVTARTNCATMFGYGPRYLHSTGQLHKGGANNGVFLVIAADPVPDLDIPGEPFTFGVLEIAQATGDFQSLDRTGRRALYVRLARREGTAITQLARTLTEAIA